MKKINENIYIDDDYTNISKTQDIYLNVIFKYDSVSWTGGIPIIYRYYGRSVDIKSEDSINKWILECYEYLHPNHVLLWNKEQQDYLKDKMPATKLVFDKLNEEKPYNKWICRTHETSLINNQPAARIKSLKEEGYVILTQNIVCNKCKKKTYHDLLVELPRSNSGSQARSTISESLKARIYSVLENKDVFFDAKTASKSLIIDHKFPSTRWSKGEEINHDKMTDEQIKEKFQLLTNQSNLLKERICQNCIKTNQRGKFLGISWYYQGDSRWSGVDQFDEKGCHGCPWYDLEEWKNQLNEFTEKE